MPNSPSAGKLRVMRFLQLLLILIILASAPVFLFTLGTGLMHIYETAGMVVFLLCGVGCFITVLGVASLLDKHQP